MLSNITICLFCRKLFFLLKSQIQIRENIFYDFKHFHVCVQRIFIFLIRFQHNLKMDLFNRPRDWLVNRKSRIPCVTRLNFYLNEFLEWRIVLSVMKKVQRNALRCLNWTGQVLNYTSLLVEVASDCRLIIMFKINEVLKSESNCFNKG